MTSKRLQYKSILTLYYNILIPYQTLWFFHVGLILGESMELQQETIQKSQKNFKVTSKIKS
jgi:hypothetical protein